MNAEELAFHGAICDNHADDTARLVYADWLDEHDQADRAKLIRVQCQIARLPNPRPCVVATGGSGCVCPRCLLDLMIRDSWATTCEKIVHGLPRGNEGACFHRPDYVVTGFGESQIEYLFARGFVTSVTCAAEDWLRYADTLAWQPIERVMLTTTPLGELVAYDVEKQKHIFPRFTRLWPRIEFTLLGQPLTFRLRYIAPDVPSDRFDVAASAIGRVNSEPFWGFQPGAVLLDNVRFIPREDAAHEFEASFRVREHGHWASQPDPQNFRDLFGSGAVAEQSVVQPG